MCNLFSIARPFLHLLPPEMAHELSFCAVRYGFLPSGKISTDPIISQNIFGLEFKNPLGMAAGFDKNAVAINSLLKQGFGFVEAGTVTPLPQSGNERPRVFRLSEDHAVVNRLGFNNKGLEYFIRHFYRRDKKLGIAGANIGKNKDTEKAVDDYVRALHTVYPHADYITINISSPNTKGLRDLQQREALSGLLVELSKARSDATVHHGKRVPLLLKIAPDIDYRQQEDIAEALLLYAIDGLIISNTTISRPASLISKNRNESGGLSGKPLFQLSTMVLAEMYKLTGGKIPIIGVGGISSAEDAYTKIRAGACLVQLYSALIYQGFSLVRDINNQLPQLLRRDGFTHISEAIGTAINPSPDSCDIHKIEP